MLTYTRFSHSEYCQSITLQLLFGKTGRRMRKRSCRRGRRKMEVTVEKKDRKGRGAKCDKNKRKRRKLKEEIGIEAATCRHGGW
ncbi:Hypothetical protein NTJ_11043 [Nesidiocoris tenuis]|uniref:Uncharacterized protein n=1 Tax=Nesidiocoris tenuis TaxID=355587 RepID=A0ABN7B1V5_9HEMI|nr:Hypothetical protein NTJ_11043 [Nesidiocoris tenuis]